VGVGARWWAVDAGAAGQALAGPPPTDKENGAVSEQVPLDSIIDATQCGGELIKITGTLHQVSHFRPTEDGQYHVNTHFNSQNVKGVGLNPEAFPETLEPTGTEYVVPSSFTVVENFVPIAGEIVGGIARIDIVVQKGSDPLGDDQVAFFRIQYIITAEGEVKLENIQTHFECH
jgi:hypothetical protein